MHDNSRYQFLLTYVQEQHRGQERAGGVPVWHHLVRVADILDVMLDASGEGGLEARERIVTAALGHDLIEDTSVTIADVERVFGKDEAGIIAGMTNSWGDSHPQPYVEQVAAADEPTRLTKLADLYDNYASAAYTLTMLGTEWATDYYLPIVEPMWVALSSSSFTTYAQTAERLIASVSIVRQTFLNEVGYVRSDSA